MVICLHHLVLGSPAVVSGKGGGGHLTPYCPQNLNPNPSILNNCYLLCDPHSGAVGGHHCAPIRWGGSHHFLKSSTLLLPAPAAVAAIVAESICLCSCTEYCNAESCCCCCPCLLLLLPPLPAPAAAAAPGGPSSIVRWLASCEPCLPPQCTAAVLETHRDSFSLNRIKVCEGACVCVCVRVCVCEDVCVCEVVRRAV